jgi:hypothetical protein
MCIIAVKDSGVDMPTNQTIRIMFQKNPDGAGYMIQRNGKGAINIKKGFHNIPDFMAAIKELDVKKEDILVMHFRIETSGGISDAMCHPFVAHEDPLVANITEIETELLCFAHNGIMRDLNGQSKEFSDTSLFAQDYLSCDHIQKGLYESVAIQDMIEKYIDDSRLSILHPEKGLLLIGDWIGEGDLFYSNKNYKETTYGYDYSGRNSWNGNLWGTEGWKPTGYKKPTGLMKPKKAKELSDEVAVFNLDTYGEMVKDLDLDLSYMGWNDVFSIYKEVCGAKYGVSVGVMIDEILDVVDAKYRETAGFFHPKLGRYLMVVKKKDEIKKLTMSVNIRNRKWEIKRAYQKMIGENPTKKATKKGMLKCMVTFMQAYNDAVNDVKPLSEEVQQTENFHNKVDVNISAANTPMKVVENCDWCVSVGTMSRATVGGVSYNLCLGCINHLTPSGGIEF